ncbi:MAG: DUF4476 domain-containing protein [Deltaproteobacteria bacterium]|nr:DUF4476 domain-containing protein [Deltaproteobacteria bacterium]
MTPRIASVMIVAVTMALAGAARADHGHGDRRCGGRGDRAQVVALQQALSSLDRAMADLTRGPRTKASREALAELGVARVRVAEALRLAEMELLPPPPPPPVVIVPPDRKVPPKAPDPMDDRDFADLLSQLKGMAFGSERVALLRDAVKRHRFTTGQVRQVVAIFNFGSEQVDAAATMYPRVVDKADFFKVIADLEFESERDELRRRVEEWDRAGVAPPPGVERP